MWSGIDKTVGTSAAARIRSEEKEKAENKREIARMKEKLPGNVWIPSEGFSQADSEEQKRLLMTLTLESKVMSDSITNEDKRKYYSYQLKASKDKVDINKISGLYTI